MSDQSFETPIPFLHPEVVAQPDHLSLLPGAVRTLLNGTFIARQKPDMGEAAQLAFLREKKANGKLFVQRAITEALLPENVVTAQASKTDFAGIAGLDSRAAVFIDRILNNLPHPTEPMSSSEQLIRAAQVKLDVADQLRNHGDTSIFMLLSEPIEAILRSYAAAANIPKSHETEQLIMATTYAFSNTKVDQHIDSLRERWKAAKM